VDIRATFVTEAGAGLFCGLEGWPWTDPGANVAPAPTIIAAESTLVRRAMVSSIPERLSGTLTTGACLIAYEPVTANATSRESIRRDSRSVTVIPSR
jgi:hypothetical protein